METMLALFKELVMEDCSSETKQCEYFSESREVTTVRFSCFIGVDLHKTTVTLRAVDPSEKLISSLRTHTQCVKKIENWINELPEPKWLTVESVSFTEWFIDRYRDLSIELTLLMPLSWRGEEVNAERLTETMRSMSLLDWSTATLLKPSNAGWYERFRQDCNRQNS
jgi:hypothetical protein